MGGAPAGDRGRDLGRQQRRPRLPRREGRVLAGRASRERGGRFIDAHDWTIASFFQHTPDERSAAAHPRRRVLPRAVRGRDVAHAGRQEPVQPQARRGRGRGPDHARARRQQPARARGDAPGRQEPRDPRHRPGRQRPVLRPAAHDQPQGPGVRRRVRGPVRPRADRAGAGPVAPAGHDAYPPAQVPRRRNPRTAPGTVGGPDPGRTVHRAGQGRPRRARLRRTRSRWRRPSTRRPS